MTRRRSVFAVFAAVLLGLSGCEYRDVFREMDPGLQRMLVQRRKNPFDPSAVFRDGRAMRVPPEGTVARGALPADRALAFGIEDGRYLDHVPVEVTRALLVRGRDRFEIFCAACHGVLGDGSSGVAENMVLVRPPSVFEHGYPPGMILRIVSEGFGLMPSYATVLDLPDRWAVVAYLEALQLSQGVPRVELSPELARRAEEALR